jgi:hypothetical protein
MQAVQQLRSDSLGSLVHLITRHTANPVDWHLCDQSQLLIQRIPGLEQDQSDDMLRDQDVTLHDQERIEGMLGAS